MSQSLSQIYIHLIFSTKNRVPFIDEGISNELYAYLGGICRAMECDSIKTGGYYDHVHILCKLSKKVTLMKLLEEVKKNSSKWIKAKGEKYANFYWQGGYAAFSVNPNQIGRLVDYISHQKEHHRERSFQDECRSFFKKYNVNFDERYVWG